MSRGQLSTHFHRSEFACRCGCGRDTIDAETLALLEELRAALGDRPIRVTSGFRCADYNAHVGGKPASQHLVGRAADIQVDGLSPEEVFYMADKIYSGRGGLGLYDTFVHLDTRTTGPAHW